MRVALLLSLLLAGCASYEPERLDALEVLRALEASRLASREPPPGVDLRDGLDVQEAAALALARNPGLVALRGRLPVAAVAREAADLWPDPQLEWQANNAIADFLDVRKSGRNSYIAGATAMLPLPRPGELDARVAVATAQLARAATELRAAEADLARDVRLACARVLRAEAGLELGQAQAAVTGRIRALTDERRGAGQATALEAALARLPYETARAALPPLEAEVAAARQALNLLLGLPPTEAWTLDATFDALAPRDAPLAGVDALVAEAVVRRPDVALALWEHREADAALALEVARQWPEIAIGTGISIELPIFSRWNHHGVEGARLARDAARDAVTDAVARARADVHATHVRAVSAHRAAMLHAPELEAAVEAVGARADEAVQAGQAPLLELLAARVEALEARRSALEARASWAEAGIELSAATGAFAPPPFVEPREEE